MKAKHCLRLAQRTPSNTKLIASKTLAKGHHS